MVWVMGTICMIILGAALVVIGLYLPMIAYAIVGGILVLVGICLLEGSAIRGVRLPATYGTKASISDPTGRDL